MIRLCNTHDISENSSKGFKVDDLSLFLIHKNQQFYLYKNSCPHIGIELNWLEDQFLDVDNSLIQCSTHGALFLIENGQCVAGPCQGKQLTAIPHEIINNEIFIEPSILAD